MADTSPTQPESPRSIHLGLARTVAIAFLWVSPIWAVLFLVTGPLVHLFHPTVYSHSDGYDFQERPNDDSGLIAWVESQPGLRASKVEREDGRVNIRYDSLTEASLEPPWEPLGYSDSEGSGHSSLGFSAIQVSASTYAFAWAQMAVMVLGLTVLRRRARGPLDGGFGTALRQDAFLGAGIGLLGFGIACVYAVPFGSPLEASGAWAIVQVIPAWEGWLILALAVSLAPVCLQPFLCERAFTPLARSGGARAALWTYAIVFALLQGQPGLLPVHVALGLGLAWSWKRTGGWTAPIVAHATFLLVSIGVPLALRGGLGTALSELMRGLWKVGGP